MLISDENLDQFPTNWEERNRNGKHNKEKISIVRNNVNKG